MLMPQWCRSKFHGHQHTGCTTMHTVHDCSYSTHMHVSTLGRVTVTMSNTAKLHVCVIKQSGRNRQKTMTIWACAKFKTLHYSFTHAVQGAKVAKLGHICSWDFTWVAKYLVVQMDLSRWKAVVVGSLLFTGLWIADNSYQGEHNSTQRLNSKI